MASLLHLLFRHISENCMTTLMSSEFRTGACVKASGRSRLVMRRPSHEWSARAKASAALYQ
jgi:hypothetical protein